MNRTIVTISAVALAGTLTLAGCGHGGSWQYTRGSNANLEYDLAECEFEGVKASSGYYGGPISSGIQQAVAHNNVRAACMQARGYVWR